MALNGRGLGQARMKRAGLRGRKRLLGDAAGPDLGPAAPPGDRRDERGRVAVERDLDIGLGPARHGREQPVDRFGRIGPSLDDVTRESGGAFSGVAAVELAEGFELTSGVGAQEDAETPGRGTGSRRVCGSR